MPTCLADDLAKSYRFVKPSYLNYTLGAEQLTRAPLGLWPAGSARHLP